MLLMAGIAASAVSADAQESQLKVQSKSIRLGTAARATDLQVATKLPQLTQMRIATQADQQQAKDLDGKGPSVSEVIALGQSVAGSGAFDLPLRQLVRLSPELIPDANAASGLYYYRPSRYFLRWTPNDGYYLTIDYKFETEDGRNVLIDARLTPGPVQADLEILRSLLGARLQSGSRPAPHGLDAIRLLPLPAGYEARFDWRALDVPEAEVAVTGRDRDTGQLSLTLATDVGTREILLKKLGDVTGLPGEIVITPQQVTSDTPALTPFSVRAELRLADSEAYGLARWRREPGEHTVFRNEHPFPVRLRYLAYLYRSGRTVKLRGYDLGHVQLTAGARAHVPNAQIHRQIDAGGTLGAWYVYDLRNEETARDALIEALSGGVADVPVKRLAVQVVGGAALFEQYSLFKIVVRVESPFFDPEGERLLSKSYELDPETPRLDLAPLYVPEDHGGPLYTYRLALVTTSGEVVEDQADRSSASSLIDDILIGSSQVEDLLAR
ncbi:MAG: hypothetical protein MI919_05615 [Holophagales bacterium]|nr:hypothetical protein [Holophagales bacterium]